VKQERWEHCGRFVAAGGLVVMEGPRRLYWVRAGRCCPGCVARVRARALAAGWRWVVCMKRRG